MIPGVTIGLGVGARAVDHLPSCFPKLLQIAEAAFFGVVEHLHAGGAGHGEGARLGVVHGALLIELFTRALIALADHPDVGQLDGIPQLVASEPDQELEGFPGQLGDGLEHHPGQLQVCPRGVKIGVVVITKRAFRGVKVRGQACGQLGRQLQGRSHELHGPQPQILHLGLEVGAQAERVVGLGIKLEGVVVRDAVLVGWFRDRVAGPAWSECVSQKQGAVAKLGGDQPNGWHSSHLEEKVGEPDPKIGLFVIKSFKSNRLIFKLDLNARSRKIYVSERVK